MEKFGKINILYEDNHIIVVEKPANVASCPDASNDLDLKKNIINQEMYI